MGLKKNRLPPALQVAVRKIAGASGILDRKAFAGGTRRPFGSDHHGGALGGGTTSGKEAWLERGPVQIFEQNWGDIIDVFAHAAPDYYLSTTHHRRLDGHEDFEATHYTNMARYTAMAESGWKACIAKCSGLEKVVATLYGLTNYTDLVAGMYTGALNQKRCSAFGTEGFESLACAMKEENKKECVDEIGLGDSPMTDENGNPAHPFFRANIAHILKTVASFSVAAALRGPARIS